MAYIKYSPQKLLVEHARVPSTPLEHQIANDLEAVWLRMTHQIHKSFILLFRLPYDALYNIHIFYDCKEWK
jgi:hypothetical protein